MTNIGLLMEYEAIMTKQRMEFSSSYIKRDSKEKDVVDLFRYVFRDLLNWTAEEICMYTTQKLLDELHLGRVKKKIEFPPELDPNSERDTAFYLASIIYPDQVHISKEEKVLNVYKKVLSGELRKFPKNFFMNAKNAENIRICLRYAIRENLSFSSVEELYDFFSNESQAVNFLRKVKLYSVYKDFFHTPVQMLHESLAESQKNEWLYRCGSWKTYMNKNKMLKKRKKDGKTFYTLCTRKEEIHAGSDTK